MFFVHFWAVRGVLWDAFFYVFSDNDLLINSGIKISIIRYE